MQTKQTSAPNSRTGYLNNVVMGGGDEWYTGTSDFSNLQAASTASVLGGVHQPPM